MSILSDTDLLDLHAANRAPVTPFLTELHRPDGGGPSYGLSSAGYDVRLSNEFAFYRQRGITGPIDPTNASHIAELEQRVVRSQDAKITLYPGAFVLAATEEIFNMPDDCIGRVTDKSTWARLGVCVQNTVIEPGWTGQLVLEITNHNSIPVVLTAGVGIAQIIFERLQTAPATTYRDRNGKYQNQRGITLPK